jgi:non-ribosomal peptide synthetase component F
MKALLESMAKKKIHFNYLSIPIGKPLINYRVYILDRDIYSLVPIGVRGELCP